MSKLQMSAIVAGAVAMVATSCTVSGSQDKSGVMSRENVEENVREFVYPLPTAFEVTEMLNRIEAAYIVDICNPRDNVDKYVTEAKRAQNMGVYSADLCYASTYNQQANVMEYTQAIRALVDALDMTQAVDPELATKMEDNENNKEGMTELISNAFYDSYDYLNKHGRGPVSLMIVAGSWVEGLYIATHISDDTFDNKEMVKILLSQKEPLEKLVKLLDQNLADANIKTLRTRLQPLNEIYSKTDANSITEETMKSIKDQADAVRSVMVDPSQA